MRRRRANYRENKGFKDEQDKIEDIDNSRYKNKQNKNQLNKNSFNLLDNRLFKQ